MREDGVFGQLLSTWVKVRDPASCGSDSAFSGGHAVAAADLNHVLRDAACRLPVGEIHRSYRDRGQIMWQY